MVTTSRILSTGDYQVGKQFDEYTLPNNSYATQFNGTKNLHISYNSAFVLNANFTIECWFYPIAAGGMILNFAGGSSIAWASYELVNQSGSINFAGSSTNTGYDIGSETGATGSLGAPTLNAWNHIAVTRSGNVYRGFLNGVQNYTQTLTLTPYDPGARGLAIGSNYQTSWTGTTTNLVNTLNGYISNVRIVKGTALYTANFTPASSPLTAVTGTSLLTCQNPTIVDNSTNAFTITNNGSVTTTNIPSTFYSGLFNGTNSYLSVASNSNFIVGTSDYTIEMWVYQISRGATSGTTLFSLRNADDGTFPDPSINPSDGTLNFKNINGTIGTGSTGSVPLNTWTHIAFVRASGTVTYYINGQASGTTSQTTNWSSASTPKIGGQNWNLNYILNGYISNLRFVNGRAVYNSNFTPSTRQLTAIAGTSLLLLQSPTLIDNSSGAYTVTNNNGVVLKSPASFIQTKMKQFSDGTVQTYSDIDEYTLPNSMYATQFNGSSQWLNFTGNSSMYLSAGAFTVECWIYMTGYSAGYSSNYVGTILANVTSGAAPYGIEFEISGSSSSWTTIGVFGKTSGNAIVINTPMLFNFSLNTWYHVAWSATGSNMTIYVNGNSVGTSSYTSTWNETTTWSIGRLNNAPTYAYYFPGYISNLRVIKGTALYTSNFTPSTSPLTTITNTSLLTCQNSTFIDNSLNAFTITNNGTATATNISSTFYTGLFNGSNQYLTVPSNSAFSFGTADFTIECWVWTAAYTNTYGRMIIDSRPTATNGVYWNFGLDATGKPGLNLTNGGTIYTSSISVADSKWHHIAVTRSSGTIRMFVDGASVLTPVTGSETTGSSGLRIGMNAHAVIGGFAAETFWNGYLSNVRIINGTALYTTTFEPPTRKLSAVSGTSFLTLQSPTIIDNSTYASTITNNNTVTVKSPASFIKTKSRLFNDGVLQASGEFDEYTFQIASIPVTYLIVAGGGAGTTSSTTGGVGGGGAGGLLTGTTNLVPGRAYSFVVGGGGTGGQPAGNGSNSTGLGLTAIGGGGGNNGNGSSGGSGGGGGEVGYVGGAGTAGQGNAGGNGSASYYYGGGGGGAGAVGTSGTGGAGSGNGGIGAITTIITTTQATSASVGQVSASNVYFAGGGGGSVWTNVGRPSASGAGGLGGGGQGSASGIGPSAGSTNSGGGGGAYGQYSSGTTTGGSGIIIISVATANYTGITTGSPTVTTSGSQTILIFKSSGSYTA